MISGLNEPQIANVHNHTHPERRLVDRQTFKERRLAALAEWQLVASLAPASKPGPDCAETGSR